MKNNRIISTGYNGVPEGMTNCLKAGCFRCSSTKDQFPPGTGYDVCICVHAEQNALLAAARFGISVEGAHLYTTCSPVTVAPRSCFKRTSVVWSMFTHGFQRMMAMLRWTQQ